MDNSIITLKTGDIIELEDYDAIVISTNSDLKAHTLGNVGAKLKINSVSLDARVRNICGRELVKECEEKIYKSGKLSVGEAFVSKAPNMNYKYIIHTVAPDSDEEGNDEFLLKRCYTEIFSAALSHDIGKIAIPAIATNYKKYPVGLATRIAVETARDYCGLFDKITFVINKNSDKFEDLKENYKSCINNERIDTEKRLSLKIEIEEYNKKEIKNKLKFLPDVIIAKILQKGIMRLYKLCEWLGIKIKISSENINPIIDRYLNDIRIKFMDEKAYILIDLKNVNITELISDVLPLLKYEGIKIILKNINNADEEKKIKVLNACFDMLSSGNIIQNIFSELVDRADNKAFKSIKKYAIKIGKIQFSQI